MFYYNDRMIFVCKLWFLNKNLFDCGSLDKAIEDFLFDCHCLPHFCGPVAIEEIYLYESQHYYILHTYNQ